MSEFLARVIGEPDAAEATAGNGSLIGLAKRLRTLLTQLTFDAGSKLYVSQGALDAASDSVRVLSPRLVLAAVANYATGGTTGAKAGYTVPAGKSAVLRLATLTFTGVQPTAAPTWVLYVTRTSVSYVIYSQTSVASYRFDLSLSLEAGDVLTWNLVTLSADASARAADLSLSIQEYPST